MRHIKRKTRRCTRFWLLIFSGNFFPTADPISLEQKSFRNSNNRRFAEFRVSSRVPAPMVAMVRRPHRAAPQELDAITRMPIWSSNSSSGSSRRPIDDRYGFFPFYRCPPCRRETTAPSRRLQVLEKVSKTGNRTPEERLASGRTDTNSSGRTLATSRSPCSKFHDWFACLSVCLPKVCSFIL